MSKALIITVFAVKGKKKDVLEGRLKEQFVWKVKVQRKICFELEVDATFAVYSLSKSGRGTRDSIIRVELEFKFSSFKLITLS